jgi:hypothetical protein
MVSRTSRMSIGALRHQRLRQLHHLVWPMPLPVRGVAHRAAATMHWLVSRGRTVGVAAWHSAVGAEGWRRAQRLRTPHLRVNWLRRVCGLHSQSSAPRKR